MDATIRPSSCATRRRRLRRCETAAIDGIRVIDRPLSIAGTAVCKKNHV
jgi:hypothetical protein